MLTVHSGCSRRIRSIPVSWLQSVRQSAGSLSRRVLEIIMDRATAEKIVETLSGVFSDKPALRYGSPYQLLVAVILSAQCTDERVNKVTEVLFKDYGTPEKMAEIDAQTLEKYVFSCGLYKTKAAHIISATRDILDKFGGRVPGDLESLRSLAGVGRKTANVVYSVAFGGNAIAVDTHVFRVSN